MREAHYNQPVKRELNQNIIFWGAMHLQLFQHLSLCLLWMLNDPPIWKWPRVISSLSSPELCLGKPFSSSINVSGSCTPPYFVSFHSFYPGCPCFNLMNSSFRGHLTRSYPLCSLSVSHHWLKQTTLIIASHSTSTLIVDIPTCGKFLLTGWAPKG